jgi:hypothetical protein
LPKRDCSPPFSKGRWGGIIRGIIIRKGMAMIFPRGEVVHKNLSTAYTDLYALVAAMKSEGFNGTIEIEFPENRGILFFRSGEIVDAEARVGAEAKTLPGQEAVQALLSLSKQKNGAISIYRLTAERAAVVARNLQNEIIFKGLSTDFTKLEGLLMKLREEKHNGFIEVLTKGNQPMGVLFLEEGEPVEMYTIPESGPSVFGRKSIPIFVESVTKAGAIFNVYRAQKKTAKAKEEKARAIEEEPRAIEETIVIGEGEGLKELIFIFQDILARVENWVDETSERGTFLRAFNRGRMEKSGQYFFLDPFSGEFEYRDGTIRFTGETSEKDFAKGVLECLRASLPHLEKEVPRNKMFPLKLRAEIENSLELHSEAMKRFGIETTFY